MSFDAQAYLAPLSGSATSPLVILGSSFAKTYSIRDVTLLLNGASFLPPPSLFSIQQIKQNSGGQVVSSYVASFSPLSPPPVANVSSLPNPTAFVAPSGPPTVSVVGFASVSLPVFSTYIDQGAKAWESSKKLAVMVSGLPPSNFTNTVTSSNIVILYSATDSAGITAVATRIVSVYDPCAPERTCDSSGICSQLGRCNIFISSLSNNGILASSGVQGSTTSPSPPPPPKQAQQPPTIRLLGAGTPFVTPDGDTGLITTVFVGSGTYVDAGEISS